jgi:trehalose/maltose hydrolase-like predicted phosphorylase
MQDLLVYCAAPAPYPFFEGETQKNSRRAKEDEVRIKGRQFSPDLKIDTINNPTLARILVSYQKPLEIKEGELVEPIGVRRNKNRTYVECRFISPEQKAKQQMLASIEMSGAPKGQLSVCDILNIMHDMPSTLKDIGISARTAEAEYAAKLAVWKVMLQDCRDALTAL